MSFRVYVMTVYKNATIFNLSSMKVSELLRCNLCKAQQLIDDAKSSPWFSYNKRRNSLRALSLKSKVVRFSKRNQPYRSDFCFKYKKRYVSLSEMFKRLQGILSMMIVLQASGEPSKNGATKESHPYIMVYQKTIGNVLGISKGTVSKLMAYLSDIGWISKTKQAFYIVVKNGDYKKAEEYSQSHYNCKLMQRSSSRHDSRTKCVTYNYFGCFGLGYHVSDTMRSAFRHIIWTHSKRVMKAA